MATPSRGNTKAAHRPCIGSTARTLAAPAREAPPPRLTWERNRPQRRTTGLGRMQAVRFGRCGGVRPAAFPPSRPLDAFLPVALPRIEPELHCNPQHRQRLEENPSGVATRILHQPVSPLGVQAAED